MSGAPSSGTPLHRGSNAIVLHRGELLLLRRAADCVYWPEYWCPPGGGAEPGETPLETAVRELREETGIMGAELRELSRTRFAIRNSPEVLARPHPPRLRHPPGEMMELTSFFGELAERPAVTLDPHEHREYAWVALEELAQFQVIPWDLGPLRQALARA